jgi:crotonobetainyl-CoA:carnitine CoA-transferase CaiB-like acyl-CoA transferase
MNAEPNPPGPLAGVRVIDLATERAELTGRILADLGAEVIKVEPPGGARARFLPPFASGHEDDPDGSLYWAAVALGKRSVVLDVGRDADRTRLRALLAGADILVESFDLGMMDSLGLSEDDLTALNPRLIHVSVTPYGLDGPVASCPATDLTIEAAGGLVGLQGDGDRPPVPVGFPQASFHAGAQAAADAVIALCERERSGLGQRLDTSAQAAIVWTLMHATGFPPNLGDDPPGTSAYRADPPPEVVPGVTLSNLWPCADGYVYGTIALGEIGGATMHALMGRLEEDGALPPELRGIDWRFWLRDVQTGALDAATARAAVEAVAAFFRRSIKRDLHALALERGLLLAPIATAADLLSDQQLAARDYWQQVDGRTHPGVFARLSRTPVRLGRRAPSLGEDQAILDAAPRTTVQSAPRPAAASRPRAFDGLKVADFAWVGVGPITSKALADHGATVVHVETSTRPDILRLVPPFKDGVPGIDRAQFMANFNSSKLGLALNLADEQGRKLARRLIDWADVVVESFTPGTMARWGMDYATLSKDRPDLIMLSTCLRGQTGPERTYGGFGGQGAALAGLHGITGWPDRAPAGTWGAYTDFIAPRYAVAALASALYHRARTGEGQYIDESQIEAAIHFMEPLVLDYTVNGRVAPPAGHDSLYACPHGVYCTAGTERYVAIAVQTAEQWRALCRLAPLEAFAKPPFDHLAKRQAARPAIDAALAAWTRDQEPFDLARRLKEAGVPASVVMRPSDLYRDAQLLHRGFFVTLDHAEMGPTPYDGAVTRFSATPGDPRFAAPTLGQHTHAILPDLLGLTDDDIVTYAAAGVLS